MGDKSTLMISIMNGKSFHLRQEDKPILWRVLAVTIVGMIANSYLLVCETTCSFYAWQSFAIIWMPVLLGYIVTVQFGKKLFRVTIAQRCLAHTIANIFSIAIGSKFLYDPDGEGLLVIIFLFVPAQLLLLLIIESLLKIINVFLPHPLNKNE